MMNNSNDNVMVAKENKNKLDSAILLKFSDELLKGITCDENASESNENISKNFLRKLVELCYTLQNYDEFSLFVKYFVAKNTKGLDSDLIRFKYNLDKVVKSLREKLNKETQNEQELMKYLQKIFEYTLMKFIVKAKGL